MIKCTLETCLRKGATDKPSSLAHTRYYTMKRGNIITLNQINVLQPTIYCGAADATDPKILFISV